MNPGPLVSVIIPTYNNSAFLIECLNSVINQTYKNIEIILIDDGSEDNTKELIEPFLQRIIYIYQENRGQSAARNIGINKSKGEYIAFLDSDDYWVQDKIEKQLKFFNLNPDADMICTDAIEFDKTGKREKSFLHQFGEIPTNGNMFSFLISMGRIPRSLLR